MKFKTLLLVIMVGLAVVISLLTVHLHKSSKAKEIQVFQPEKVYLEVDPPASSSSKPAQGVPEAKSQPTRAKTLFATKPKDSESRIISEQKVASFHRWADQYRAAVTTEQKLVMEKEGLRLALQRREAMVSLIQTDPNRALELTVPYSVRREMPSSISSQFETVVNGRGKLDVLALLLEPGSDLEPIQRIVHANGQRYHAYVYGWRVHESSQKDIAINGIAIGNTLALSENPVRSLEPAEIEDLLAAGRIKAEDCPISQKPALPQYTVQAEGLYRPLCSSKHAMFLTDELTEEEVPTASAVSASQVPPDWSLGPKKLLLFRVKYPDDVAPVSDSGAASLLASMNDFYSKGSYGGTSIIGTVTPLLNMPYPKAYYLDQGYDIMTDHAMQIAINMGYKVEDYQWWCFICRPTWDFGGVSGMGARWSLIQSTSPYVISHEVGHGYGLNHAFSWDTSNGSPIGAGRGTEYGNPFDTMGGGKTTEAVFGAFAKYRLNWLTSANAKTITSSGTYRLHSLDVPTTLAGTSSHALVIKQNATRDYWLEFRQKYASNKRFQEGIILNWGEDTIPCLLDMTPGSPDGKNDCSLIIGRTLSDPFAGVHITPIKKNGTTPESIDVVVNFGAFPSNQSPTVTMTASATTVAVNTVVNFSASASDPNGDTLAYSWEFGDKDFATNTASTSKSWSIAGDYVVRCIVSDMKGGVASAYKVIRVGSPTTFQVSGSVTVNGQPMEGVEVSNGLTTTSYRGAFTDSNGNYTITGLAAGTYTLKATKFGHTLTISGFTNPVAVGPNQTGKNFVATVGLYSFTGYVNDLQTGAGVSGVNAVIGAVTRTTDATGKFSFTGLANGVYTLTLSKAGYSLQSASQTIYIDGGSKTSYFTAQDISNKAPMVVAGSSQKILLSGSVRLGGKVYDDGRPNPPGTVAVTWSKFSGPGIATFSNASVLNPTVTFSQVGTYVLRLSANDGQLTGTGDVTITVVDSATANLAPTVSAGSAQTVNTFAAVLNGSATDDGLPNPPGALSLSWSKVSGPGSVTFASATANTMAKFSQSGAYVLRLTATDGALIAQSDVSITVQTTIPAPSYDRLAAGYNHTTFLNSDGTAWSWGENIVGQLGVGSTNSSLLPIQLTSLGNTVKSVKAGWWHSIALKQNGSVWAWGGNVSGQVGDGTLAYKVAPTQVTGLGSGVAAIGAGAQQSLAMMTDGKLQGWGENYYWELADGTGIERGTPNRPTPVVSPLASNLVQVAVLPQQALGLQADGTATWWGRWSHPVANYHGLSNIVRVAGSTYGVPAFAVVKSDGTVWGWGYGLRGELGGPAPRFLGVPTQLTGLSKIVDIDFGMNHLLALSSEGKVYAMGFNSNGQLGDGTKVDKTSPVLVQNLTGVVAIAAGDLHSLALKADGAVWAWGANPLGQLGDGTRTDRSTPVKVFPTSTTSSNNPPVVNAGVDKTMTLPSSVSLTGTASDDGLPNPPATITTTWSAVSGPGTVTFSNSGALSTTASFSVSGTYVLRLTASDSVLLSSDEMTVIVNPSSSNVAPSVNAGLDKTVTLPGSASLDGTVSDDGLPNPPAAVTTTWSKVSGPGTVTFASSSSIDTTASFSVSGTYVLRLTADDSALSTSDDVTVVVNPSSPSNQAPVVNAGANQIVTLPASASLSGSVSDDGLPNPPASTTKAWSKVSGPGTVTFGSSSSLNTSASFSVSGTYVLRLTANDSALITTDDVTITVNASSGPIAGALAGGSSHSLALKNDGTVRSWGLNSSGQLGIGSTNTVWSPTLVSSLANVMEVSGGQSHSLMLKADGTVWSCGYNGYGQLGDGTTIKRTSPVQVLSGVSKVQAGSMHSLVLKLDGSIWSWGYGLRGERGDGTTNKVQTTPVQVLNLTGMTDVAGGGTHSIGLKSDGTVWTWGYNLYGQLGLGYTNSFENTPVNVPSLSGIIRIAAGNTHTTVLKNDGTVWSFGRNLSGQLGDGTTAQRATPVRVSGLSGVVDIAAGPEGGHTLALKSDGTVWAWGAANDGQLGEGTNVSKRLTPVQVTNLNQVAAIAAGASHSLAMKSDGTVWVWGRNQSGQLGIGSTNNVSAPVNVSGLDLIP
jgi:alpha-tubulin suppressor-like RCC1 family protein